MNRTGAVLWKEDRHNVDNYICFALTAGGGRVRIAGSKDEDLCRHYVELCQSDTTSSIEQLKAMCTAARRTWRARIAAAATDDPDIALAVPELAVDSTELVPVAGVVARASVEAAEDCTVALEEDAAGPLPVADGGAPSVAQISLSCSVEAAGGAVSNCPAAADVPLPRWLSPSPTNSARSPLDLSASQWHGAESSAVSPVCSVGAGSSGSAEASGPYKLG